MIKPFQHVGARRRVSLAIWLFNIVLCLLPLAFALR